MKSAPRLAIALAALAGAACERAPAPDVIYWNAQVVTLEDAAPSAEAVAVRDGKIQAVGTDDDVRALAGDATREIDLAGRALLPGFVDAHSHLSFVGQLGDAILDLRTPPVGVLADIPSIQGALAARAEQTPPGGWVVGMGYDDTLLAEKRHPTRADLDAVSTEHAIVAVHVSAHLLAANSRALALAGIARETADPPGGVIQRDPATSEPNGVLEEPPAMGRVLAQAPQPPLEVRLASLKRASELYAAQGVTSAQEGVADLRTLEDLLAADERGLLAVRVNALPGAATLPSLASGELAPRFAASRRVRLGAVKVLSDGSIQGYTAYLTQPYHQLGARPTGYRGYPTSPRDELAKLVVEIYAAGYAVAIHANGDAAIDDALAAIEAGQRAHPRDDDRPVIIHAQTARIDQLDAMKRLGAIPSFFVLHTYYWGDRHREIFLGPERAARISPARSAAERGIPFTLHTDAPVTPMEPLRLVWSAVARSTTGGAVLGPEERIPVERALRAVTLDAARQHFQEAERGSIAVGKLADLVVLSESPLAVETARLPEIAVLRTIVGGVEVFASE